MGNEMTDAKDYSRGANAKLAGLEYDPGRSIDWRMGWLEERPESNRGPNIPDDWVKQTMAYRKQVQREPDGVTVGLTLTDEQAEAVAQLCKRIALSDCRQLSASDDEAYQMQAGLNELQKALAKAGYSPR